jgi:hypothetical protein
MYDQAICSSPGGLCYLQAPSVPMARGRSNPWELEDLAGEAQSPFRGVSPIIAENVRFAPTTTEAMAAEPHKLHEHLWHERALLQG